MCIYGDVAKNASSFSAAEICAQAGATLDASTARCLAVVANPEHVYVSAKQPAEWVVWEVDCDKGPRRN